MEPDIFQLCGNIVKISFAVNMAENAIVHTIFFHDGQDVHGTAAVIVGRIMKNTYNAFCIGAGGHFQASFQAAFFSSKNDRIIFREISRCFRNPAAGAHQCQRAEADHIVVQKFKGAVGGFGHFGDGVPPVIVIAPDNDFSSGKGGDPQKIRQRLRKVAAPGQVSCDDDHIVGMDGFLPVFFNFLSMIFPIASENIHRLGRGISGKVEITEGVQFHEYSLNQQNNVRNAGSPACGFCFPNRRPV